MESSNIKNLNSSTDWEKINLESQYSSIVLNDNNDLNPDDIKNYVNDNFDNIYKPSLKEFIKIPNLSPAYDPEYKTNGLLEKAAEHYKEFADNCGIIGLNSTIYNNGNTPLLWITIKATDRSEDKSILMYGHLDKQPPFTGWDKNKSSTKPVEENGRLYGRGSEDDGYAFYASLLSIRTLQHLNIPHPKIKIMIEADEESGSTDLIEYIEMLQPFIGNPDLFICMDSAIGDYNRLWVTNSLRGICNFDISVKTLKKGIHSGKGSGIAPETFMILRSLLARLEDSNTGLMEQFRVEIPDYYKESVEKTAKLIGIPKTPLLPGVKFLEEDTTKLLLRNFWEPCLAVCGMNGIPSCKDAGNVLRPETDARISIRIPPSFDCNKGGEIIDSLLNQPPFNSKIQIKNKILSNGTVVNLPSDKLKESLNKVSNAFFENDYAEIGIGGSIPFVKILSSQFPDSQFIITGCANTDSNIHGPNENINLDYCKKFISCLTYLISDYKNYLN